MTTESSTMAAIGLAAAGSYLLGAVPLGLLVARARGVDIRRVGSGNIGATNVFRSVGPTWGVLVFLGDALKGFVPAAIFPKLLSDEATRSGALAMAFAFLAIVGHNWPIYLRFKGGKGIATTAGALLGLAPAALGIGFAVWAAVFLAGRYVSLASVAAAGAIPIAAWLLYGADGPLLPCMLTALGVLAVLRHRSNICRLFSGTEYRFAFGKKKTANPASQPTGGGS